MIRGNTQKLALAGLFAALSYVVFTFLQFKISLGGADATSIHLGNAVVVLGALLLGGPLGGLAGAVGMAIGDLMDPIYIVYVPKTLVLKLGIGLITGFVAHTLGHIRERRERRSQMRWATAAAVAGLGFNCVFDPLVGYWYKRILLGKSAAELTLAWNIGATALNAVLSTVAAVLVYLTLRPALERSGLLESGKEGTCTTN